MLLHILEHITASGIFAYPSVGEHWLGTTLRALQMFYN